MLLGEPDKNITFVEMEKKDLKDIKKFSVYHPVSRVIQYTYRLNLISEITTQLPRTRKILMTNLRASSGRLLSRAFYKSIWAFFQTFPYILRIWKISLSFRFWRTIPKQFLLKLLELLRNKKDLRFFLKQLIHPNHSIIWVG